METKYVPWILVLAVALSLMFGLCLLLDALMKRIPAKIRANKKLRMANKGLKDKQLHLIAEIDRLNEQNMTAAIQYDVLQKEHQELASVWLRLQKSGLGQQDQRLQELERHCAAQRKSIEQLRGELAAARREAQAPGAEGSESTITAAPELVAEGHTRAGEALKQARIEAGEEFEFQVKALLEKQFEDWLVSGRTKILHHVELNEWIALEDAQGNTTHRYTRVPFDLLLIDLSGIYFIECKRWRGLVVGKNRWDKWIRVRCSFFGEGEEALPELADYSLTQFFPSPVKQVDRQRQALYSFLKRTFPEEEALYKAPLILGKRMVVFDEIADLSCVNLESLRRDQKYLWLGQINHLEQAIRHYDKTLQEQSISVKNVSRIYEVLQNPYPEAQEDTDVCSRLSENHTVQQ